MAQMKRNLNLEEVNSDAFMGIPFLNYQTIPQKMLFWGSMIFGIILNLVSIFAFSANANIAVLLMLLPLIFGVAFGCNYNQDLSLFQYLMLILKKPAKKYASKPTEDILQLRNSAKQFELEERKREQQRNPVTAESQKKLLIKLLIGIVAFILFLVIVLGVLGNRKENELHHTIEVGISETVGGIV